MRASLLATSLLGPALAALFCVGTLCLSSPAAAQSAAAPKPVRFELRRIVQDKRVGEIEAAEADPVLASRVVPGAEIPALLADEPPLLQNADVLAARTLGYDPIENANDMPMVQLQLTEEGKRKLAALGAHPVARGYGIVLDGRFAGGANVGSFPEDGRMWVRLDPARIPLEAIARGIAPPGSPAYAWPTISWRPQIPERPKPWHERFTSVARQWMNAPDAPFIGGLIVAAIAIPGVFFTTRRRRSRIRWVAAAIALAAIALTWPLLGGQYAPLRAGHDGRVHYACQGKRFGVLVMHAVGFRNEGDTKGHALACAAHGGHLPMVRMLVALGDDVDGLAVARERLRAEDRARMRLAGMDPGAPRATTPLVAAIEGGRPEAVELLLELGASGSRLSGHAYGAVNVAVARNCFRCLEALARYKADFNDPVPALPAILWLESARGERDMLEWLEHFGAQLGKPGADGRTLLHVAAKESGMQVVDFLLAKGLDPAAADAKGMTPLMHATRRYEEGPTPRRQGVILRLRALSPQ